MEPYVARRLDEDQSATFELHMIECQSCLEAVEFERLLQKLLQLSFLCRSWQQLLSTEDSHNVNPNATGRRNSDDRRRRHRYRARG